MYETKEKNAITEEKTKRKGYHFKSAKKMSEMIRKNALMAGTDDNYSAIVCKIG